MTLQRHLHMPILLGTYIVNLHGSRFCHFARNVFSNEAMPAATPDPLNARRELQRFKRVASSLPVMVVVRKARPAIDRVLNHDAGSRAALATWAIERNSYSVPLRCRRTVGVGDAFSATADPSRVEFSQSHGCKSTI